ncbi:hypothetical protein E2C01_040661 [Portunus trituberculatus]|uniref:Uncharacterized protein n=1 Tax=Portunus trituberculatus TaxID=210409 RepID=A0A5B7FH98_PORTR|nr:hypothetical protein [Portunus trituberculatus]
MPTKDDHGSKRVNRISRELGVGGHEWSSQKSGATTQHGGGVRSLLAAGCCSLPFDSSPPLELLILVNCVIITLHYPSVFSGSRDVSLRNGSCHKAPSNYVHLTGLWALSRRWASLECVEEACFSGFLRRSLQKVTLPSLVTR